MNSCLGKGAEQCIGRCYELLLLLLGVIQLIKIVGNIFESIIIYIACKRQLAVLNHVNSIIG